jgi:hypothetical protein
VGSRLLLCLHIIVAQGLTLFPMWFVWYLAVNMGWAFAGEIGAAVAFIMSILLFAAVTYTVTVLATLVAQRVIRGATFFSPSFVARRTTLGLLAGFCGAALIWVVLTLAERYLSPKETPWDPVIENIAVVVVVTLIVCSWIGSMWVSSRRHVDSLGA